MATPHPQPLQRSTPRRPRSPLSLCAALGLAIALAAGAPGCGGEPTPEDLIRAQIQRGELAVEKREMSGVDELLSQEYSDERGADRRLIMRYLAGYFLRKGTLHLLTHIRTIELLDPESAVATVTVAVATTPFAEGAQLHDLRADTYQFEFSFALEDATWLLRSAKWRRATASDFL